MKSLTLPPLWARTGLPRETEATLPIPSTNDAYNPEMETTISLWVMNYPMHLCNRSITGYITNHPYFEDGIHTTSCLKEDSNVESIPYEKWNVSFLSTVSTHNTTYILLDGPLSPEEKASLTQGE